MKTAETVVLTGGTAEDRLFSAGKLADDLKVYGVRAAVAGNDAEAAPQGAEFVIFAGGFPDLHPGRGMNELKALAESEGASIPALRDRSGAAFLLKDGNETLLSFWTGHAHLRMTPTPESLLAEVKGFLGIPKPLEIEHKYLIRKPEPGFFASVPGACPVWIRQTYLRSGNGPDVRLRMRGEGENICYFKTVKKYISPTERVEEEERLTREEYDRLMGIKVPKYALEKTRWCFMYGGRYFELDLYPFLEHEAILECEVLSSEDVPGLPPELRVIREVSGEREWSNAAMAKPVEE